MKQLVIPAGPAGTLLVVGDTQNPTPVLLQNVDPANTLFLGDSPNVTPTNPLLSATLAPGQSIVESGLLNVFGIAAAGQTVQVNTYTGSEALVLSPGQLSSLIAGDLASGGVPTLRNTTNLGSGTVNLAGNQTQTILPVTGINQTGYEGSFNVYMPGSSGTVPFVKLTVLWTDQITGMNVGQRQFFLTCGNGLSNVLAYYVCGPARGNEVSLILQNMDPSITATVQWGFNMTSHTYGVDKINQPYFAATAPYGYSNPAGTPAANVLLNANPSVGASSTITRLTAVFGGAAIFFADNTGSNNFSFFLVDPVATGNGLYGNVQSRYAGFASVASGNSVMSEVSMPYGPLLLQIVNGGSAAGAPNVGLIGIDNG